jgi:uncharacterized membrane protein YdjX (TVP38/TMEM64 family)
MMDLHKRLLLFLSVLVIAGILLWYTGFTEQFFLWIKIHRDFLIDLVATRYMAAIGIYLGIYAFLIALSLPLASVMNITGGFLFGTVLGSIYAIIGATIGATISFLLVRAFLGKLVQKQYAQRLHAFNAAMAKEGTRYLVAVHFIAVIPFFVVTMLMGLTNISPWTFIWTTAVGIIPSVVICAFAGQQLTTIDHVSDVFSSNVILAFVLLALLALLPPLAQRLRKKDTNKISKRRLTIFVAGVILVLWIILRLLLLHG